MSHRLCAALVTVAAVVLVMPFPVWAQFRTGVAVARAPLSGG